MKKIYLIDDGTELQRTRYEADYLFDGSYNDFLEVRNRIEKDNDTFLDNAYCLMVHTSFGQDNIQNEEVKKLIATFLAKNSGGYIVEFSNRFGESVVFDRANSQYLRQINKDKFYKNLSLFLENVKINHITELKILCYGLHAEKEEIFILARNVEKAFINQDKSVLISKGAEEVDIIQKIKEIIEKTQGKDAADNFILDWDEIPKTKHEILTTIRECLKIVKSKPI